MQSCGTWNTGCCSLQHPNIISFDNLKTKYSINEDIYVDYTLHGHVEQASTRDWLGIFPRGWTNLQQYLTFEYALVAPRAAASQNRGIIFPRVFHQEASTTIEYQLVYVSKEIQVLATSSYFRFIRGDESDPANHVIRLPRRARFNSLTEKREIDSNRLANSGWAPPRVVLSDQSLLSLNRSKTVPANLRLPRICRTCGRPRENYACGQPAAAGRASFLPTHNATMADLVVRLERDLDLAELTKSRLADRLRAYENFVEEMIRSLATKRIVKLTDASGKEMILQQLPDSEEPGDRTLRKEISNPDNNDAAEKVQELFSAEENNGSGFQDEIRPNNSDAETQTEKEIHLECTSNTSGIQNREDNIEGCKDRESLGEENGNSASNAISHDDQPEETLADKGGSRTDGETDNSNIVNDEGNKSLQSKPSAIVIQGSNVKFAIIRY